jgi:hypothetical protein
MHLRNSRRIRRIAPFLAVSLLGALVVVSCDLGGLRARTSYNIYDNVLTLAKGTRTAVFIGFQKNDTATGRFQETGQLKVNFIVQDTHDFNQSPYDAAHALLSVMQASADTFQIGFPQGDSIAFEFTNPDTTARSIELSITRTYWHDTTQTP